MPWPVLVWSTGRCDRCHTASSSHPRRAGRWFPGGSQGHRTAPALTHSAYPSDGSSGLSLQSDKKEAK